MKMNRWSSLLLTLALCLGLLPGAALATEEGTESSLPEGYEQMYVEDNGNYVTVAEGTAGMGGDILFYVKLGDNYVALNETQQSGDAYAYTDGSLTVSCDAALGEAGLGRNGTNWRKRDAKPGASGCFYAVSGESKYAIEAKINGNPNVIYGDKGNSEFTVKAGMEQAFTFPPTIYVDGVAKRLVADDYNSETYTFTTTVGSLYWHAEHDELAINTAAVTSDTTGEITITNTVSGAVYTCEVTVREDSSGEKDNPSTETSIGLQLYAADGTTPITANEDGSYIVNITEGADTIVYVRITGDDAAVFDEGTEFVVSLSGGPPVPIVDSALSEDGKILKITHHGAVDAAEYMESGRTLSVGGQQIVLAIKFVNEGSDPGGSDDGNGEGDDSGESNGMITVNGVQYSQMYYQFKPGSYATDIELSLGGSLSLEEENLFADAQGTVAITKGNGFTFSLSSDDLGHIVPPYDPKAWEADDSAKVGAAGYLYAVKGDQKYAIAVSVIERISPPSGPVMLAPERPLEESDKRVIDWDTFDWDAVDTITYKGVTYCVGSLRTFPAGGITVLQPDRNGKGQGETRIGRCVGFYQPGPEGTIITPESSVIAELVAGFNGTLKLDLYAVTNPDSEYFKDYAKNYPATYAFNGFTDWPCRIAHYFSKGTDGRWLIEVTGTFTDENGNQKQVCTQATYTNENPPIEEYTATNLDDASEKLAQWAEENDPTVRYFLNLPQGKWTGTLVIPEGCDAFIRGNDKTTIVGGVQNDGGDVVIQGVQFIGAGKVDPAEGEHVWEPRGTLRGPSWRGRWESTYEQQWLKTWPKESSLKGSPNYAIYGTGAVQIQGCSFRGYLHVIHCAKDGYGQGVISGDINSTFRDNAIVYYLDGHLRGLANSDMLGSRFIRNGCVFWIDGYTRNQHTGVYRFLSCIFKENQIDAVNLSKRWFFMDHNFFMGKDAEGNDVIGPVFVGHNGNANKKETHVSAFPYAADEGFHELIYDKDAIMSSGKTSENKIPEEELNGMTITIIENDQEAAVWSFGEEE